MRRLAPAVFVLLWSTGFIGSALGSPYAEPFTFLALRFLLVLALIAPLAAFTGNRTRGWRERTHAMITGTLIHGIYLGGVFWSIRNGMPAAISALIVSLQPILTALVSAPLLGERLLPRHWAGLGIGLAGAALILQPGFAEALHAERGITVATVAANVVALAGITAATIYQKRFLKGSNLLGGIVWQYVGAVLLVGTLSLLLETRDVHWTPSFLFALGWLVLVLSIGAVLLLMLLIRTSAVVQVSGLFYLEPAVVAVMAWMLFGDVLSGVQLAGLVLATAAVIMISAGPRSG